MEVFKMTKKKSDEAINRRTGYQRHRWRTNDGQRIHRRDDPKNHGH